MTPPFPPLPLLASPTVEGWYNLACQKREREMVAQNILDTLAPGANEGLRKRCQEDLAFALQETWNARELYLQALEDAEHDIPARIARKTA